MNKQTMIELIQSRISTLQDSLAKVSTHVPNNIPGDVSFSPGWVGGQFWARIPPGGSFGILRRQMGRKWTFTSSTFYPDDGERVTKYTHQDGTEFLFVVLPPPADGQSCWLAKVGEKTINQYEVICN